MANRGLPLAVGCVVEYLVPGILLGLIAPNPYPLLFVLCVAVVYGCCKIGWGIAKDTPARRAIRRELANSLGVDRLEDVPKSTLTLACVEAGVVAPFNWLGFAAGAISTFIPVAVVGGATLVVRWLLLCGG